MKENGPDDPRAMPHRVLHVFEAKCFDCGARCEGPGTGKWADDHTLKTGHDVMVDAMWETRGPRRHNLDDER